MNLTRILACLTSLLCVHSLRAGHVIFNLYQFTAQPEMVRSLTLYPIGLPVTNGTGGIITRDNVTRATGTNGSVTISNIFGGSYRSEFQGISLEAGKPTVTTNWFNFPVTNGVIVAADWTTNGPISAPVGFGTMTYSNAFGAAGYNKFVTNVVNAIGGGYSGATATNSFYPTNNPSGFVPSNNVAAAVSAIILTNFVWPTGTGNDCSNILAYASNGVAVGLMPGTYNITNASGLFPGTNGGFYSVGGPGAAFVLNGNTNGRIGISLTENSFVDGLHMSNQFNNFCMACVGYHGEITGLKIGAVNYIRNCILDGDCDDVHFTGISNAGICYLDNNRIGCRDDGIVVATKAGASTANYKIISRHNYVYPQGPPTDGLQQNAVSFAASAGAAAFIDYGSIFYASNGTGAGSVTLALSDNVAFEFHNSLIFAPPGSNTFTVGQGSPTLLLDNCTYNPSQIFSGLGMGSAVVSVNTNTILLGNGMSSIPDNANANPVEFRLYAWDGDGLSVTRRTFTAGGNGDFTIEGDFVGGGSLFTDLNASGLSSGTIPVQRYGSGSFSGQFTNAAAFNPSNLWLTATNTRKVNISRRGTWEVDFGFKDAVAASPIVQITVENPNDVPPTTNTWTRSILAGLATTLTNGSAFKVGPGGTVSVTNISGSTADITIGQNRMVWE
jgi:hypothetical protein